MSKYTCAVCKKRFLTARRPPLRWEPAAPPKLNPGEAVHVCGSTLPVPDAPICSAACLHQATEVEARMLREIEADLAALHQRDRTRL